jgi:predicted signal transduction protein with EAL and GGDEF domain
VSRTKSNEMLEALPDLTLAIRIDGGIHDYIGGAALPTLRPKRRAVEGGFESSWSSQMDTLVKRVVRHAIAGRTPVNAELIDNSIRYDIRAIAKRPDLAICVIRLSTAQTAADQAEVTPAPHLDRRGFLRRLSDSLSVAALKEQPLAISIIRVEGLQDLIQASDSTSSDELMDRIMGRLHARPETTPPADPCWYAGQLNDNLLVCLIESADRELIEALITRLCDSLRAPIDFLNASIQLKPHAGVAILGKDGVSPKSLIDNARTGALEAFRADSNCVYFFSDTLKLRSLARLDIHHELREAIENRDIRLRYVGRHDLLSGELVAVVGYLSWQHPLRGEVRPTEFLNIAEATGLSDLLAASMLQCLREDFHSFDLQFPTPIRLSFGPLRHHILSSRFLSDINLLLTSGRIAPDRLEIRIAERTFITSDNLGWRTLGKLGVQLIVDEVGRKMSSFDQLTRAPLSGLQLDRSWASALRYDETALKICRAAIAVATALDLTPIATGVDNADQRDVLRLLGCAQGIGDLYASDALKSFTQPALEGHAETALLSADE